MLACIHEQLQNVVQEASATDSDERYVKVPWERFQNLLFLQRDLAGWLQAVANPDLDQTQS